MKSLYIVFAVISLIISVICTAAFFALITEANSAPQQAAASAMVLAPTITFYVIARSLEMLTPKE